jgi:esterase/lipase
MFACQAANGGLKCVLIVFVYCLALTVPPANSTQSLVLSMAQEEAKIAGVTEGTEKIVVWAGEPAIKTNYAIVYIHGYSATRQETHPLTQNIAQQLGANVFYTRLTGHGLGGAAMAAATKQDWLNDIEEAAAIGRELGDKVILIGVSTGATLSAIYTANNPADIYAMVLISPNFKVRSPFMRLLQLPHIMPLVKSIFGDNYSWEPKNPLHDKYWTNTYPLESVLPMLALLDDISRLDLSLVNTPLITFYSPDDEVINVAAIKQYFASFGSVNKELISVDTKGMLHSHVIAGDILAPQLTNATVAKSIDFIAAIRAN